MHDLKKEVEKLEKEIIQVQRELFIVNYLFTDVRQPAYGKVEVLLHKLDSGRIIYWGKFAVEHENINNVRIPEMRLLREVQILKELLEREKEGRAKTFKELRILRFSPEILRMYEEYKRKRVCWRKKAILDKFLNTDKYLERFYPGTRYLSNTEIQFHRYGGVHAESPEVSYYCDMCWFYNSYLDSLAEIEKFLVVLRKITPKQKEAISNETLDQILEIIMSKEFYRKININLRFLRATIVSAVTFVESVINAFHFEFLNAPQYEKKREKLWSDLNNPNTSKGEKRNLAQIFRVDPANPKKRNTKSYPSLHWRLKSIPPLLSGKGENKPDPNKDPFKTFSSIRKDYRNSLIHPKETIYQLVLNGRKISECVVNATIGLVEDLYKLSFGTKHDYLWWWLAKTGDDGKFPDPDRIRKLSEIRNRTKNRKT